MHEDGYVAGYASGCACQGLIGRAGELAALERAVEDAAAGPVGVLVSGAPGMGKSSLLAAAAEMAVGFEVLRAEGIHVEAEAPFAALNGLLRPLSGDLAGLTAGQRDALAAATTLGAPLPDEFVVGAGLLALFASAAERRPLLIAVDDVQWLDRATLAAVLFAFRRLENDRILLLAAARALPGLEHLHQSGLRELPLGPLDPEAARALARRRIGPDADEALLQYVVDLGAGVPLALVELAGIHRAGDLASEDISGSVTQLVERLFGRRLEQLSPAARNALLLAALNDETQLDAILAGAERLGIGQMAWEEAEHAGVLRLEENRAAFVHPLLREAVKARAVPSDLRRAHRALADAMAAGGDPERALLHESAGTLGTDEGLAARLELSAEVHRARAGHLAAAHALEHAARLSPSAAQRARRLLDAGDSARRAGRGDWAETLAVQARATSADHLLHARSEFLQAHVESRRGSMHAAFRRYMRVADQSAGRDVDLTARTLSYAASAAVVAGDALGAVSAARAASAITDVGPQTIVSVRETLGSVLALLGETREARPILEAVADWYEAQPERMGAEYVAEALIWLGEFERARRLLGDVADDARRLGAPDVLVQTLVLQAELGYRTGAWRAAMADASEAVRLAEDTGQSIPLAYALAMRALLGVATEAHEETRALAHRARDLAQRHGLAVVAESAGFAIGALELVSGRPEHALVELEAIAAAVADTGRGEPAVALWAPDLIEALIVVDRRPEAARQINRLAIEADRTEGTWARGVAARYRGFIADGSEYDRHFSEAVAWHTESRMPFELARTRLSYGQKLRRDGRRVEAREQLRHALATFRALPAAPWATRTERELTGSGDVLRPASAATVDELTPQELQIARYIATGATTREAAAALFLSPKTIETHLTRIYRKLGVRSRSQLTLIIGQVEHESSARPGVPKYH